MIQRIQTVYLLVAAVLMAMTLMTPLATFTYEGKEIVLSAFGITGIPAEVGTINTQIFFYLIALLILPTLLPIVIIFLFKKRMLQIRLCVSEILLLLGAAGFIAIFCWRFYDTIKVNISKSSELIFTLEWASIMPVIAMILVGLAIRSIAKDEALVRSLDRIR